MITVDITKELETPGGFRTELVSGLFDVPISQKLTRSWHVELPLDEFDWQIGLIVGPSGVGKSVIAQSLWPEHYVRGYTWDDRSILDAFPQELDTKEIVGMLTSVGFSSPPDWIKPYGALSTGQQMRADLSRALCEATATQTDEGGPRLVVFDEFTSVVDRLVARVGSAALAKAIRKRPGQQFIAVTCHSDVEEWLTPDWTYEPATGTFTRRSLCPGWEKRPPVALTLCRVHSSTWALFRDHHYLSADLNVHALCYMAEWEGVPLAFMAVLPQVGFRDAYRGSRLVVLPDYQGIGLGQAFAERVAEEFLRNGKRYRSTMSHPALLTHKNHASCWRLVSVKAAGYARNNSGVKKNIGTASWGRSVATFEYVGYAPEDVPLRAWQELEAVPAQAPA